MSDNSSEYDSDSDESVAYTENSNDSIYNINPSNKKFHLVIAELYVPYRYGNNEYLSNHIMNISKVTYSCNPEFFYKEIAKLSKWYRTHSIKEYVRLKENGEFDELNKGNPVRNWENIIKRPDYCNIQIAQCIRLDTGETVCVIKTFWLKIIQRTWKKVFKERQRVLKNIYLRQTRGKVFMPSLTGMLCFYGI